MSVENEMGERQFEIIDFIAGRLPDIDDLDILCTADVLSINHCFKYFVYRGRIQKISPLSFKAIKAGDTELPDRFDYLAELHDEVGKVVLRSPTAVDEKEIYAQMVDAHNADQVVELQVAIFPYSEINEHGEILNVGRKIISVWPIKLRVVKDPGEIVEFYHSGTGWKINFRRTPELYGNEIGFYYLHELLKKPNKLISTADLYFGKSGYDDLGYSEDQIEHFRISKAAQDKRMGFVSISENPRSIKAMKNLRKRIKILTAKIENQSESDSEEEIDGYHEDIELATQEMMETLGVGTDKDDFFIEIIKKTRTSVQKAIMGALKKIKKQQPALGAILADEKRVQTGGSCRYVDDLDHPITWLT